MNVRCNPIRPTERCLGAPRPDRVDDREADDVFETWRITVQPAGSNGVKLRDSPHHQCLCFSKFCIARLRGSSLSEKAACWIRRADVWRHTFQIERSQASRRPRAGIADVEVIAAGWRKVVTRAASRNCSRERVQWGGSTNEEHKYHEVAQDASREGIAAERVHTVNCTFRREATSWLNLVAVTRLFPIEGPLLRQRVERSLRCGLCSSHLDCSMMYSDVAGRVMCSGARPHAAAKDGCGTSKVEGTGQRTRGLRSAHMLQSAFILSLHSFMDALRPA